MAWNPWMCFSHMVKEIVFIFFILRLMVQSWAASNIYALLSLILYFTIWYDPVFFMRYWIRSINYFTCVSSTQNLQRNRSRRITNTVPTNSDFWCIQVPQDIKRLCIDYVGFVIDSSILSNSEQFDLNMLLRQQFNASKYQIYDCIPILYLQLLYRINDANEFDLLQYRKRCIDHHHTLVMIKNEFGNVFGGFTSLGIPPHRWYGGCRLDPFVFLLRIRSRDQLKPESFIQHNYTRCGRIKKANYGMSADKCHIVEFGNDDLKIHLFCCSNTIPYPAKQLYKCSVHSMLHHLNAREFVGSGFEHKASCNIQSMEVFKINL
eukprot:3264_1